MPFVKMCAEPGCPFYAVDGFARCEEHLPGWRAKRRASERRDADGRLIYYTPEWKRARRIRLRMDGWLCVRCMERGVLREAEVVDHVGGDYSDPYNVDKLRSLCRQCSGEVDGGRRLS